MRSFADVGVGARDTSAATRRPRRVALAMVAAAWVLLLAGCDWSMYRGTTAHTGESFGESTIGVANVGALGQAWTTSDDDQLGNDYGPPVVASGRLYVQLTDALAAYDANGIVGCVGTPSECHPVWRTDTILSSPAIARGAVYGIADSGTPGSAKVLRAYDAAGTTACAGSPPICQPLWTGLLGDGTINVSPPAIAGGNVYLTAATYDTYAVLAFDADGQQGCAGDPKVCQPLWTATLGETAPYISDGRRSPSVADGRVFVSGYDNAVHVFDAAGQAACSGSPKQCGELWTAAVPLNCIDPSNFSVCGVSTPAVSGGHIYVSASGSGDTGGVYVFDASGMSSCSGSPKVCAPLWRTNGGGSIEPPAVANGVVLAVGESPVDSSSRLRAFDAAGVRGCSGTPTICAPQWQSTTTFINLRGLTVRAPVVAKGVVYTTSVTGAMCAGPFCSVIRHLYAFDVAGVQNCTGAPKQCAPLLDLTPPRDVNAFTEPIVANGVLYVGERELGLPSARVVHAYRP